MNDEGMFYTRSHQFISWRLFQVWMTRMVRGQDSGDYRQLDSEELFEVVSYLHKYRAIFFVGEVGERLYGEAWMSTPRRWAEAMGITPMEPDPDQEGQARAQVFSDLVESGYERVEETYGGIAMCRGTRVPKRFNGSSCWVGVGEETTERELIFNGDWQKIYRWEARGEVREFFSMSDALLFFETGLDRSVANMSTPSASSAYYAIRIFRPDGSLEGGIVTDRQEVVNDLTYEHIESGRSVKSAYFRGFDDAHRFRVFGVLENAEILAVDGPLYDLSQLFKHDEHRHVKSGLGKYYSLWRKVTPVEMYVTCFDGHLFPTGRVRHPHRRDEIETRMTCFYESNVVENDEDGARWVQVGDGKHIEFESDEYQVPSEFVYTIRKRVPWR